MGNLKSYNVYFVFQKLNLFLQYCRYNFLNDPKTYSITLLMHKNAKCLPCSFIFSLYPSPIALLFIVYASLIAITRVFLATRAM